MAKKWKLDKVYIVYKLFYADSRKIWTRIKKLKGYKAHPIPLVSSVGNTVKDQADALEEHLEHVFSSSHYARTFLQHKKTAQRQRLRVKQCSNVGWNTHLTRSNWWVHSRHMGSQPLERIELAICDVIRHLHRDTLNAVLCLLNKIWQTGRLQRARKEATVVPLLKEEKESRLVASYRPIALTSCLSKLIGKMKNRGLFSLPRVLWSFRQNSNGF